MKLHVVLAILGVVLLAGCATTLTEHQLANRILGFAGPRSCRLYYAGSSDHYDHFAEYNVGSTRYRRYKVKKGLIAVPAPMPETKDLCFWRLCHLKRKAGPESSRLTIEVPEQDGIPFPAHTPYDHAPSARSTYLKGFRSGYRGYAIGRVEIKYYGVRPVPVAERVERWD